MGEQACVCDLMRGIQCALHAELRDKRNDLLDIRGLLSPNGGTKVVPMELGNTVAPAVEWLIRDRADLVEERAELVGQLADARHELDVLRGLNTDLQQRLDLALTDLGRAMRERNEARGEVSDATSEPA